MTNDVTGSRKSSDGGIIEDAIGKVIGGILVRGTGWFVQELAGTMLLLAMVSPSATQAQVWNAWHNALAPQGTPSPDLTLVSNGSSNYRIVKPALATPVETKAAADLQTWIQQITGYAIPILSEDTPLGSLTPISVGQTNLLTQAGLPPAGVDLGEDGYCIAVRNGKLFLYGGSKRGPINAVYALLEEDIGCRWYSTDHSRLPSQTVLTVAPVERTYKPALWLRDPFYYAAFNEDWSVRNRTNAPWAAVREDWGGHIDYDGLFVHTVLTLVPPSQYYGAHPEYFMMDAGGNRVSQQLCLTNTDVRDIITQKILQTLAANPNTEIVEISKMDTHATCLCPVCKPLDDAEGSGMGSLLPLVNYVAEQIEPSHPNVLISTLAYFDTLNPPATLRPRHNVVVRICNTEALTTDPFTPMSQTWWGSLLASWAAIHDKLTVWDYTANFHNYLAPTPNMHVINADIPFMAANSVIGVMTQGGYQDTCERDTMRAWVIAKLLWNPSLDGYQMQQDFIWGHFGNAAGQVSQYYDLLQNQYALYASKLKHAGLNFPMDVVFLTADFLNAANAIFDQAEALAEDSNVLNRVQRERLAIMYVWLERGPEFTGPGYGALIDRFETIARREGVDRLKEGSPNLDLKLQQYRDNWQQSRYTLRTPSPNNAATNVSPTTQLTWTVWDTSNVSFKVFFGPTNPPPLRAEQTSLLFDPGRLLPYTTWFWQVVLVAGGQEYPGPVWRFTTRRYPDFEADADVDLSDFAHLQLCITGEGPTITDPKCQDADLNNDGRVDQYDVTIFVTCMSGADAPANQNCLN